MGGRSAARPEPDYREDGWLHTIIMVGGGLYLCWMGFQMLRGALKKRSGSGGRASGRTGAQRPELPERAADQSG